jgi:tRNA/tmRNA/rRNA uracil-C5-methylase (TrmA/RlmC/RlmD family)
MPTYALERVQPVDMFPQTAEIELIARFSRV